jgi:hypothetical protein
MKLRLALGFAGLTLLTAAVAWQPVLKALAAGEDANAARAGNGRTVDLTVYNQDFAMVRETRGVALNNGVNSVAVGDVSKELDPQSVLLRWLQEGKQDPPQITGNAYDLGIADSQSLLKQRLGEEVELVRYGMDGRAVERTKGKVVVAEGGRPSVFEADGKLFVQPEGTVIANSRAGAATLPQLSVQVQSPAKQSGSLDLTYLTRGLEWNADYAAILNPEAEDRMEVECTATVINRTGVTFPNANISLAVGTPNRAVRVAQRQRRQNSDAYYADQGLWDDGRAKMMAGMGGPAATAPSLSFQSPVGLGEFHTYPLKAPATIVPDQLNRLAMLRSDHVRVKRDYSFRAPGLDAYYSQQMPRGTVTAGLSFFNKEKDGLGQPLPSGALRVYDPDADGRLRYAGASTILSTPKDGKIGITLANAFDLTAEYRTLKSQKIGKRTFRKQIEVKLKNEKKTPAVIRVVQDAQSGWKLVGESAKHVKLAAEMLQWSVPVKANGETTLRYTVDLPAYY